MRVLAAALLLSASAPAWAQTCPGDDACDEDTDGVTVGDGDCDDLDGDVFPGAEETCDDGVDQDCNGDDDTLCDVRDAELIGGSGCGARGGWVALFLPLPWLWLGRRR